MSLVKRTLAVKNTNSQPIAFKVKTTAPKQYCVRPNSGRIEPGETVEVQVLLQPMKEDPPPGTKCRDKFLVQSVIITPERDANPLAELWTAVEKEDKASTSADLSIHEQKIRCSYLPAAEPEATPAAVESPAAAPIAPLSPAATPPSTIASTPTLFLPSVPPSATNGSSSKEVSSSSSVDPTNALKAELSAAKAEIEQLKRELAAAKDSSGLRQRNVGGGERMVEVGGTTDVLLHPEAGVPVKVVAGIVAGVFVFTWLFF